MKRYVSQIITHPLFSSSAVMVIGSNSANVLNYIYHFVIGRMLGPTFYGELVSLISLTGLLGVIPGSMSLVVIKYISSAKTKKEIANLVGWLTGKVFQVSLIFFILTIVASPAIASFLHINKIIYLILIASTFLFSLATSLNRSILQGLLKFKEMIISVLVENGIKLVASILLVYLGYRVGGAMLAFVISAALGWYLTNLYLKIHLVKKTTPPSNIKSMALYVLPVIVQSLALTSLYSSDVMLVKHFFSSYEAGIYASLSTLGKIIFFGTGPIGAVMFPIVSHRQARGQGFRRIFVYSFLVTGILASAILLIYWLFPEFAIRLLYGSAYLAAKNLLIWFGIFITLFTLSSLMINFNLSLGRTHVVLLPLIASIAQIIAIWFLHQSLFMVILVSTFVTALLLVAILIYSSYGKRISNGDKLNFDHSASI